MGMEVARWHHEKWDASGYPDGLEGNEIPLCARIMAVVDVYDALRSERPYKKAFAHEQSTEMIVSKSGTEFDPMVIEAFKESKDVFNTLSKRRGGIDRPPEHFF